MNPKMWFCKENAQKTAKICRMTARCFLGMIIIFLMGTVVFLIVTGMLQKIIDHLVSLTPWF